jgi:uncharacterized protein YbjT (DUF2867 family)
VTVIALTPQIKAFKMKDKFEVTVFGGTGKTGNEVVRLLSAAGVTALAVSRNVHNAAPLPGITWRPADMLHMESLYPVLAQSKTILLYSAMNEQIVEAQCNVIEAAVSAGVQHIVKLSSAAADPRSALFIPRAHGEIEECLKNSGINATLLRPTGFMQNWLQSIAPTVKSQRKIYEATGEGKRAYIDLRDIAAVAFAVLTAPEKHIAHAYELTGSEALNYRQIAALLGAAVGEDVTYVSLGIEEAYERMQQRKMPAWAIDTLTGYAKEQREGRTAAVSPDVEQILMRPARSAAAFINEHLAAFK